MPHATEDHADDELPPVAAAPNPDSLPDNAMVKGTGSVMASKFQPPVDFPPGMGLFSARIRHGNVFRYTYSDEIPNLLLVVAGAYLTTTQGDKQAGWAFVQGADLQGEQLIVSGHLEKKGPWGDDGIQNRYRTYLRAVIAALRFRRWAREGFRKIIVATRSNFIVQGSTSRAREWVNNRWRNTANQAIKNRDLWEVLLGELERYHHNGVTIQFWNIPPTWNEEVHKAAAKAAEELEIPEDWEDACAQ